MIGQSQLLATMRRRYMQCLKLFMQGCNHCFYRLQELAWVTATLILRETFHPITRKQQAHRVISKLSF